MPASARHDARPSAQRPRRLACAAAPAHRPPDRLGRGRGARPVSRLYAGAGAVHARHQRYPQGQVRAAGPGAVGRRQAAGRVQARQPRLGAAGQDLAERGGRIDLDRGPPLLPAFRPGLAAHRGSGLVHAVRRPAGRLDADPAVGAQPVSRGNRPRRQRDAQDQGSDHRAEDRGAVFEGRDSRDLSEYGAVPVQRDRHRDGGTHLFRQASRPARRARERHAGRHAQGHQLLQPGAQSRARGGAPQYGAGADGQARQAQERAIRGAEEAPAADRLRTPDAGGGTGPAFRAAAAQMADRLGRPQRLQHLHRRTGGPYDHRFAAAGDGQPGGGAPGGAAAGHRQRRVVAARRLERESRAGRGLHARDRPVPGRTRGGPQRCRRAGAAAQGR